MHPVSELSKVASEFHHLQAERAREGVDGSWRRRHGMRLDELEQSFETLVRRWVSDPAEQERWRQHLHRGDERPLVEEPNEPPQFLGRSEAGSTLLIRANDGGQDFLVDGRRAAHWPTPRPLDGPQNFEGSVFHEFFQASSSALEALLDYVQRRMEAPPWEHARELFDDGLIDATFGLTARGRRLQASRQS